MRRAQLLSILMVIALAAVLVTVLVTTARRPDEASRPSPTESADAETLADGETETPEAALGSENGDQPSADDEDPAQATGTAEEAEQAPSGPSIRRIALNGQDLADLLELSIWKFAFRIPENEYTLYLWIERWSRNAQKPEIRELATVSGVWSESEVVLKLPTEDDERMFFRIGDVIKRTNDITPLQPPTPWRRETLQNATLNPGRDVYLITYTHNELETATGGRVNVHRQNDETIYVKMRFTPGPFVPFDPERISAEYY